MMRKCQRCECQFLEGTGFQVEGILKDGTVPPPIFLCAECWGEVEAYMMKRGWNERLDKRDLINAVTNCCPRCCPRTDNRHKIQLSL